MPYLDRMRTLLSRRMLLSGSCAPVLAHASPDALTFATLYGAVTAEGVALTGTAKALVGRRVTMPGFMAPPLKAESDFFVLTRPVFGSSKKVS